MRGRPYDEMFDAEGTPRAHCHHYCGWLNEQPSERLARKRAEADALFHRLGITFAVYGENAGTERLIPFDIVPRILPAHEWAHLERGLKQRVRALNAFLADIYHEQEHPQSGRGPGRTDPGQCAVPAGDAGHRRARRHLRAHQPASMSCATTTAASACSRTTCACPPASPTCSRTAR